uniref:50S ribosomal protein L9, chloroplastic n=1 Tax=Polysiphonia sp. TaxID=1967842 RepID=A0A1Z1MTI0_9FLOR|nr:ribosomal protein L9 [Polysiphonia sp.]
MKKKISVILTQDNIKKATKGSIINTTRGYAFNYLIPNQIAKIATSKTCKHIKMFEEIKIKNRKTSEIETQLLHDKIEKIDKITIYKKKGDNESIFGSVTEKDVVKWFYKYTNLIIQKSQIKEIKAPLIGIGLIIIDLNASIKIITKLYIIPTNI